MQLLKIATYRDRFRDYRTVVEFKERHAVERVHRGEGLLELLVVAYVELYGEKLKALLGQEHSNAFGVGSRAEIVELHALDPFFLAAALRF
jgi:hypothetical protein